MLTEEQRERAREKGVRLYFKLKQLLNSVCPECNKGAEQAGTCSACKAGQTCPYKSVIEYVETGNEKCKGSNTSVGTVS